MVLAVADTDVPAPEPTRRGNPRRGSVQGPRRAELAIVLGLITAIGPLSIDMYLPAFPQIVADFNVHSTQVQLSLTTCLIGLAVGQLTAGPLSDRWGRRRPVLVAVAAYAIFSLLCAIAPSAPLLAFFRLLQGLAGGAGVVVARALVRDLYSGVQAAKFYSQLTLIFGVAPIAAPSLGSAVLRLTSWPGIFVTLGVLALLLTGLAAWRLPETLPPARRSTGGLAGTARTARTLFADKVYLGYALSQALAFAAMFGYIAGSPFVLQDGYGISPTVFSLLFGLNAVGLIAASQINRPLLDRFPPRSLLLASLAAETAAGGAVVVAAALGNLIALAAALFLLVSTFGMIAPNATALALDRHPERAGTASALLGGIQSVIGASVAPLVGIAAPGHGMPMAIAIVSAAVLALLSLLTLARPQSQTAASPADSPAPRDLG
jgi:DHA1 family bicyclomycin/chloramphenicol resistance-like MFS transporter